MRYKLLIAAMFLASGAVNAETFISNSGDEFMATDVAVAGDAKATLHRATGIEWLDLTETRNYSINQIESLLASDTPNAFTGWRFALNSEVETMMAAFFSGYAHDGTQSTVREHEATNPMYDFADLFGDGSRSVNYTLGKYIDENDSVALAGSYVNSSVYSILYGTEYRAAGYSRSSTPYGVFLVSDGGVTLSSINDPTLNARNPNSPSATNVSVGGVSMLGLMCLGAGAWTRRRKA